MPVGFLSGDTTVFSNVSLGDDGRLAVSRLSSSATIVGNAIWGSTLSVTGFSIPQISSISSLVGAFVVAGSASSFTGIAWTGAAIGDVILVGVIKSGAASSISSGLIPHSHVTVANQIEFRLSNVSTLVQNQSAQSWVFMRFRPAAQ